MDELIVRLVEFEKEIEYRTPQTPGQPDFRYTPGSIRVLISAPHGAAHTRNGQIKAEDEYTAGMARLIAELTGAHVIYAWRLSDSDPNFNFHAPYKLALKEIVQVNRIKFVIDLHGCSPERAFGIALGSMRGQSCPMELPNILKALEANGYSPSGRGLYHVDVDHTFSGSGGDHHQTITRYAYEVLGVHSLQIELNAHVYVPHRMPDATQKQPFHGNPELIMRTIEALTAIVRSVDQNKNQ